MTKKTNISWKTRARVEHSLGGLLVLRRWESRCGSYRITLSMWSGRSSRPPRWYAEHCFGGTWIILSRARCRRGAERVCQSHQKEHAS